MVAFEALPLKPTSSKTKLKLTIVTKRLLQVLQILMVCIFVVIFCLPYLINQCFVSGGKYLCPSINLNTKDPVKPLWTQNVADWEACSKLCRERVGCRYWNWIPKNSSNHVCVTMTDMGWTYPLSGYVFGDRNCGGKL